jgi:hypothetical protein
VAEQEPVGQSRFAGLGEALRVALLVAVAVALAVGLLGAIIAWAADRHLSSTIALTYYIVGCLLFIVGMFPTGGFSMVHGTITRRRPTGSGAKPVTLLGVVLIGLGVVADFTRPF